MQLYYQTDVSFMTAFLLTLVAVIAYFRLNRKDTISKAYLITSGIIVFILLIEAYTMIIDGKNDELSVFLAIALNTVLFSVGPILTLSWFYLIRSMFAPNIKRKSLIHWLLFFPQVVNLIIVLTNPWTKVVFAVVDGQYVRNDWYWLVTIVTYMYVLFSLFIVIKNRKIIMKQDKILLLVITTLPMVGGAIQGNFYGILTIWPSVAFALILMYLFLQQRVIHLDFLTGAWTRETFFLHISRLAKLKDKHPTNALYFDLNHLKEINDTYGHSAGDLALKKIVELVKNELDSKDIIARLGGDEFIVFMDDQRRININELMAKVHRNIRAFNEQKTLDFELGISIGYGRFEGDYQQFDKFMNLIDQRMYQQKPKK